METYNITEAKAKFSAVVEKAMAGEEIIISKMGKPVAKIMSYEAPKVQRRVGFMRGKMWVADDFDEWPEDIARSLGMID